MALRNALQQRPHTAAKAAAAAAATPICSSMSSIDCGQRNKERKDADVLLFLPHIRGRDVLKASAISK